MTSTRSLAFRVLVLCVGLAVLVGMNAPAGRAADRIVDDDGRAAVNPADCGGSDTVPSKIQTAVDNATSGDRIFVCPNPDPYGAVEISSTGGLSLVATTSTPSDHTIEPASEADPGVEIDLLMDGIRVEGFRIQNTDTGIFARAFTSGHQFIDNHITRIEDVGIYLRLSPGNRVEGNDVSENFGFGILSQGDDNVFVNNRVDTNGRGDTEVALGMLGDTEADGVGLLVGGDRNRVEGNSIRANEDLGVAVLAFDISSGAIDSSSSLEFTGNDVLRNGVGSDISLLPAELSGAGMGAASTVDGVFRDNRFDSNAGFGLALAGGGTLPASHSNQVENNEIRFNRGPAGLALVGSDTTTVTGNRIVRNDSPAIALSSGIAVVDTATANRIENNTLRANRLGVAIARHSRSNTVVGNTLTGHDSAAVVVAGSPSGSLNPTALNRVDSNAIRNNLLGIAVIDAETNTVVRNRVTRNDSGGMVLLGGRDNRVADNEVEFNRGQGGLLLEGTDTSTIVNNEFRSDARSEPAGTGTAPDSRAVRLDGATRNLLEGNRVTGYDVGVGLTGPSDSNVVRENRIDTNGIGVSFVHELTREPRGNRLVANTIRASDTGIYLHGPTADTRIANTAARNSIVGNDEGVLNTTLRVFDARDNWWGDTTGPAGGAVDPFTGEVADGSGDAIAWVGAGAEMGADTSVAFDTWSSSGEGVSPPPSGSSGGGGGGSCVIQRWAPSAGTGILRSLRDRTLGTPVGRMLTRLYYRVNEPRE